MSVLNEIEKRLTSLKSGDPKERFLAAAEIGDYLEANCLDKKSLRGVIHALIPVALGETDDFAKESLFNALSTALEVTDVPGVDWDPIAQELSDLPLTCLEHAVAILGFSGNPKYRSKIKSFLTHPDEDVRSTADDALKVLDGLHKKKQKVAHNRK